VNIALPPYPQDIPPKLVKWIFNLEYVQLVELIQDNWEQDEHCCGRPQTKISKQGPVDKIEVWLVCYASLVAALSFATHTR